MNPETPAPDPLARIRTDVQGMHAYAVQDATGMLKLDAMENPHRLASGLQAELGRRLGAVAINRYPGARVDELKAALQAYAAPPAGWSLMLGNGSDELISLLAMASRHPGRRHPGAAAGLRDVRHGRAAAGPGLPRRAADGRFPA